MELKTTREKKQVSCSMESWRKALLTGVSLVINSQSKLDEGDLVSITVSGLQSRRLANVSSVIFVESSGGFITYYVEIQLKSGQKYNHSSKEWTQLGIKNLIDFEDFFMCMGLIEFYVGSYDSNAIRSTPSGSEKYTQETIWRVDCSELKWKVTEVPSSISVERSKILFARDAGSYSAATKRGMFPNDIAGGVLTMGGLYNEYRDMIFGKSSPTTESPLRVMVRALAWKMKRQVPFPDIGTVEDKMMILDKRLVMAKVNNIKSEFLWTCAEHVRLTQEEIKMGIAGATWEELLLAACMHWRHQTLMMYISNAMIHCSKNGVKKPSFYMDFFEGINISQDNVAMSVKPMDMVAKLQTMSGLKDSYFTINNWISYSNFVNWFESEGVSVCHVRFFVFDISV